MATETPNLSYLQNLSGGNEVMMQRLWNVVKQEFPEEKTAYEQAMERKAFIEAAELVHKIKNKIGILGLNSSYTAAKAYEEGLKVGDFTNQEGFEQALMVLTDFIQKTE